VNVDTLTGGCSHDDIRQMVEEQSLAVSDDVTGGRRVVCFVCVFVSMSPRVHTRHAYTGGRWR
jgi:hypothetical protein